MNFRLVLSPSVPFEREPLFSFTEAPWPEELVRISIKKAVFRSDLLVNALIGAKSSTMC